MRAALSVRRRLRGGERCRPGSLVYLSTAALHRRGSFALGLGVVHKRNYERGCVLATPSFGPAIPRGNGRICRSALYPHGASSGDAAGLGDRTSGDSREIALCSDAFALSATLIHKCWRKCRRCVAAQCFRTMLEISRHDGASEFVVVHRDDSSAVEILSDSGCPQVRLRCSQRADATRDDVAVETCPQANRCDARASESSRRGRDRRIERTSDARSLSTDTALRAYRVQTLGGRWLANSAHVLVHKTFA
ncbi:hypothetical protein ABIE09_002891 [Lysobacter enzymogenes]